MFISVIVIGSSLDSSNEKDMYRNMTIDLSIQRNLLNKQLDSINKLFDCTNKQNDELVSDLKIYIDSVKYYKKYKKLYNQSLIKDTLK